MKILSCCLLIYISLVTASFAGSGATGGGGPSVDPGTSLIVDDIDGGSTDGGAAIDQNTKIIIDDSAGNNWTFNPDLIKNIQYDDGQIVGLGQLLAPRTENVKVDMSDHYKLYEMGVDNIQMNSGEIILVEPQGFYID